MPACRLEVHVDGDDVPEERHDHLVELARGVDGAQGGGRGQLVGGAPLVAEDVEDRGRARVAARVGGADRGGQVGLRGGHSGGQLRVDPRQRPHRVDLGHEGGSGAVRQSFGRVPRRGGGPGRPGRAARRRPEPALVSRAWGCRRRPLRWRRWSPPRRVVGAPTVGRPGRSRHRSSVPHRRSGARGLSRMAQDVKLWVDGRGISRGSVSHGDGAAGVPRGTWPRPAEPTSPGGRRRSAWVTTKHFTPLAVRTPAAGDPRSLPLDAFAQPAAPDVRGARHHVHEVRPARRLVARRVRRRDGGRVPGLPRHRLARCRSTQVRRVVEAELGMPLEEAFATFDPSPIGRASIAVVHRATPPRRHRGGGEGAAPRHRDAGSRSTWTCSSRCSRSWPAPPASTSPASCSQMFDGFRMQLGEELDLRNEARAIQHMDELLERRRPAAGDACPTSTPSCRGPAVAHDGVPRRHPRRRPGPHRALRVRPGAGREPDGEGLPAHHDPLGLLPRRRARRQPAAAAATAASASSTGGSSAASTPTPTSSSAGSSRPRSATRTPGPTSPRTTIKVYGAGARAGPRHEPRTTSRSSCG